MTQFPTQLSPEAVWLETSNMSENGAESLSVLEAKGFAVQIGLTKEDSETLSVLSTQESIREYCPKDCAERFANLATTEKWLSKGRVAFLLKERENGMVAGYGWAGPGTNEHVPGANITGALRLSELYQGQGLATPFLSVILDYTRTNWPNESMWFETWQSNAGAVHIYKKLGFETVDQKPDIRPTASGGTTKDIRLFMKLS